jgi:hypothetical protein
VDHSRRVELINEGINGDAVTCKWLCYLVNWGDEKPCKRLTTGPA